MHARRGPGCGCGPCVSGGTPFLLPPMPSKAEDKSKLLCHMRWPRRLQPSTDQVPCSSPRRAFSFSRQVSSGGVAARVPGQQLSVNICSPESSFTSLVPGSPDSQGTAIHKGHSNGQALLTATATRLVIKADVIRTCVSPRQICLLHLCYSDR